MSTVVIYNNSKIQEAFQVRLKNTLRKGRTDRSIISGKVSKMVGQAKISV